MTYILPEEGVRSKKTRFGGIEIIYPKMNLPDTLGGMVLFWIVVAVLGSLTIGIWSWLSLPILAAHRPPR